MTVHLNEFMLIPQHFDQSVNLHESFCNSLNFSVFRVLGIVQKAVSSAKLPILTKFVYLSLKSLVNSIYKTGDRADPWGRPWSCSFQENEPFFVITGINVL